MKQTNFVQGAVRVLMIVMGTVVIFGVVAAVASLLTHRTAVTQAQSQPLPPVAQAQSQPLPALTTSVSTAPQVGVLIKHPAIDAFNPPDKPNLVLRSTTQPPLITQPEAIQVVKDLGVPWALGGLWNGKSVSVSAFYGIATVGHPGATSNLHLGDGKPLTGPCAGWLGPCNIPVRTCKAGNCVSSGRTIDRIQNRPYWIIDYGNIFVDHAGCAGCPVQPPYNHTVYAVDAQEKIVLMQWGYIAP